jgi:hypothetical protein
VRLPISADAPGELGLRHSDAGAMGLKRRERNSGRHGAMLQSYEKPKSER